MSSMQIRVAPQTAVTRNELKQTDALFDPEPKHKIEQALSGPGLSAQMLGTLILNEGKACSTREI